MSGGGGSTQTTTSNNAPWSKAQPFIEKNLKLSDAIGPANFMPYQGSTVVPNASQTEQGLGYMENVANQNMGGQGISGQYQNAIQSGGMFGGQGSAQNTMQGLAGAGGDFARIGQQAQGPSFSQNNLSSMAAGNQIGSSNPYFEDALRIASERTADATNLGASSMGRYGSGAHTQTLARNIGDMQTTARAGQVNQDIANMMQANSMIDNQRMAGLGMGLNAAQARAGAAGNLFNMGQQAFQNLGTAYQGQMAPAQTLMGIGANREDLMGRMINDEIRRYEGNQQAPMRAIEWRNAIASGAGALGGSSSTTAQMPGQNPFASALGYGLTGLGAAGSFF